MAVRRSGLTSSAVGGAGTGSFRISGVASGRRRCGGGFRGDDGCPPSLGLSVDTDFTARDSDSPLVGVTQKPRGALPAPVGWGLHRGWVLPVTAWPVTPAGWLTWTAQLLLWGSGDPMDPMLNLAVPLPFRG